MANTTVPLSAMNPEAQRVMDSTQAEQRVRTQSLGMEEDIKNDNVQMGYIVGYDYGLNNIEETNNGSMLTFKTGQQEITLDSSRASCCGLSGFLPERWKGDKYVAGGYTMMEKIPTLKQDYGNLMKAVNDIAENRLNTRMEKSKF